MVSASSFEINEKRRVDSRLFFFFFWTLRWWCMFWVWLTEKISPTQDGEVSSSRGKPGTRHSNSEIWQLTESLGKVHPFVFAMTCKSRANRGSGDAYSNIQAPRKIYFGPGQHADHDEHPGSEVRSNYGKSKRLSFCDHITFSLSWWLQSVLLPKERNLLWRYIYRYLDFSEFLLSLNSLCLPSLTWVHSRLRQAID